MADHPTIGILGGMGPEATVDLMRRVVAATPAQDDVDHIHLLVDNNPKVPSRIAALIDGTGPSPAPALIRMAQGLERGGATVLAIACNTAHFYAPDIVASVAIPLLDMIELTAEHLAAASLRRRSVGLLASTAVIKVGLYDKALAARGLTTHLPAAQERLMAVIRAVKAGDTGEHQRAAFTAIARDLAAETDILLIACTELSVLAEALTAAQLGFIDALDVLVTAIVATAAPAQLGAAA